MNKNKKVKIIIIKKKRTHDKVQIFVLSFNHFKNLSHASISNWQLSFN